MLRVVTKLFKGMSAQEISETLRLKDKNPDFQLKGFVASCHLLLERGETDAALAVANELRILAASGRIGHPGRVNALYCVASVYKQ